MNLQKVSSDCVDLGAAVDKCAYVKQCFQPIGFNYVQLYYCSHPYLALLLIAISLVLSFVCIGKVASDHLLPNLRYISKFLHLLDNVAGLTLLALGNCLPDILSTYKAIELDQVNLAISELIGSSFSVTSVIIGIILIIHPFQLPKRVFTRDIGFLFMICLLIFICLCIGYISIGMALMLMICYAIYVTYIIINHNVLHQLTVKNLREERIRNTYVNGAAVHDFDLPTIDEINLHNFNGYDEDFQRELVNEYDEFRRGNINNINITANSYSVKDLIHELISHNHSTITLNHERDLTLIQMFEQPQLPIPELAPDPESYLEYNQPSLSHYDLQSLWEIFTISTRHLAAWQKPWVFLIYPFNVIIALSIPRKVDFVKLGFTALYLNLKTFTTWPRFLFGHVPITVMVLGIIHQYPYTMFYASLGFIVSITWISTFASHIINGLKCIAVIFDLSDDLLGYTVFALGNSVGDLVANFTIAQMGMPIMAFAACFGSPILSMTSLGTNTFIILLTNERYSNIHLSEYGYLLNPSSLMIILGLGELINLVLLFAMCKRNDWFIDKRIGWVLVCNWVVVTSCCVVLDLFK